MDVGSRNYARAMDREKAYPSIGNAGLTAVGYRPAAAGEARPARDRSIRHRSIVEPGSAEVAADPRGGRGAVGAGPEARGRGDQPALGRSLCVDLVAGERALRFLDHPPMIAWFARLGTALFGQTQGAPAGRRRSAARRPAAYRHRPEATHRVVAGGTGRDRDDGMTKIICGVIDSFWRRLFEKKY